MNVKTIAVLLVTGFAGVVALTIVLGSWVTVDAGHVGVKKTMGAVHKEVLAPGFHFKKPWMDQVVELNVQLKSYEQHAGAASKDLQTVTTIISVQHSLMGSMAAEAYEQVGGLEQIDVTIVGPAVQESLKAVTAKYTAEELVTKRETVKQQVTDAIKAYVEHTLTEKGLKGALQIANVAITDFDFSPEFNASIEAKVKAEQEALKAENEKKKRITEAEAAAREKELQADAAAYQIEKESKARADAIKREANALAENPNLVRLRAVEKWDGQLPTFSGGQQPIPFIDVSSPAQAGKK